MAIAADLSRSQKLLDVFNQRYGEDEVFWSMLHKVSYLLQQDNVDRARDVAMEISMA